ncbi:MAG: PIN domain-containing protein, partial [Chloroflexota bacterium]
NKTELRNIDHLLVRFIVVPLNEKISETAIELIRRYRLSHGLLIADAFIAATALSIDSDFVTRNQRDYRFISGLKLLTYPPD